jgi:hypothetical protein
MAGGCGKKAASQDRPAWFDRAMTSAVTSTRSPAPISRISRTPVLARDMRENGCGMRVTLPVAKSPGMPPRAREASGCGTECRSAEAPRWQVRRPLATLTGGAVSQRGDVFPVPASTAHLRGRLQDNRPPWRVGSSSRRKRSTACGPLRSIPDGSAPACAFACPDFADLPTRGTRRDAIRPACARPAPPHQSRLSPRSGRRQA